MAEALWNRQAEGTWTAQSAGSKPSGYVHPLAIRAMQELDVDLSAHTSKSLEPFLKEDFDLIVTVCDNAKEACPIFPGAARTVHMPFEDPADATGTEAEQLEVFRKVRDKINAKIQSFLKSESEGVSI